MLNKYIQTAKIGGELNWINENSLNDKIKQSLNKLKNQFTRPIIILKFFNPQNK